MAMFNYILLVVVLGLCQARTLIDKPIRYDGYKVLRVVPKDDVQLVAIFKVQQLFENEAMFWVEPTFVNRPVDLMVGPKHLNTIQAALADAGLQTSAMIDDVQTLSDQSIQGQEGGISSLDNFNYNVYHTYEEINTWIIDMAAAFPEIISQGLMGAGMTYEGREIRVMTIGKPGSNKPKMVLQTGTHAREWLSPASAIKIVKRLVDEFESDVPDIISIFNNVDIVFIPVFNADGYAYTQTDRMWRKTRKPTSNWLCRGIDPNRNFDSNWGPPGSSNNPCSAAYRGPSPESEIEVSTLTSYLLGLTNVQVYIDMHCYSQFWMTPYGYTSNKPANYNDQLDLADRAMNALEAVNGLSFVTGNIADVIYLASGSSVDWAYDVAGIPYAFAPELRDTGRYGFLMPTSHIDPSSREVYAALKVILEDIVDNN